MAARKRNLLERLRARLEQGTFRIGEVRVAPKEGGAELRHWEDAERVGDVFTDPQEAIAIARYDDAGAYRPLKTAPNLRHGWRLDLGSAEEVLLALDFFYPAAWGTYLAWCDGDLVAVDLPETLARQSGMYAVVRKLDESQAGEVVESLCRGKPGCLRRILWKIGPGEENACAASEDPGGENAIPLLCAEACNLWVAAGRRVLKGKTSAG